ncbi:120.7 kDa protein in NOF-FB transposable element [Frankliniella fusca]|uniref:120.7 kDa protein in NOF-FB transposable element n=1 Tax=Frankliniella fusca TaxID=407009 RepID=A0AAE1H9L3_9NEOP|nr:120.7 kDa protein in NOF-FB transposable element [Frankliniella fusca]
MDRNSEEIPLKNPSSTACRRPCPGSASITVDFGAHLIVSVDIYGSSTEAQAIVQSVKIQDIPVKLHLLGQNFVICGIGAREEAHFVAYTRRATGSWELFNDLSQNVRAAKPDKVLQPVLLMYVPFNV